MPSANDLKNVCKSSNKVLVLPTNGFLQLNHSSKAVQCQGLLRTSSLCTSSFEAKTKVDIPLKS